MPTPRTKRKLKSPVEENGHHLTGPPQEANIETGCSLTGPAAKPQEQKETNMYSRNQPQQQQAFHPYSPSYYGVSDIRLPTAPLENLHNLSQDSGLSPSPMDQQQNNLNHTGIYDNYVGGLRPGRSSAPLFHQQVDLGEQRSPAPPRWSIGVFRTPPPPLPPKKKKYTSPTNVFQPTMLVKTPDSYNNYYNQRLLTSRGSNENRMDYHPSRDSTLSYERPGSSGIHSNSSSTDSKNYWRQHQRQRIEAQRNSLLFSSDEDETNNTLARRHRTDSNASLNSSNSSSCRYRRYSQPNDRRIEGGGYGDFANGIVRNGKNPAQSQVIHRMSAIELDRSVPQEPFPPELDFAQIVQQTRFDAAVPPPPPPRDPRRRLYLNSPAAGSPKPDGPSGRPVSYSFENLQYGYNNNKNWPSNPPPDVVPQDLGVPLVASGSEQHLVRNYGPSQRRQPLEVPPRSRRMVKSLGASQRAASASGYFRGGIDPNQPDLVNQHPVKEYWKSPPPPYAPSFDPEMPHLSTLIISDSMLPPQAPPRPVLRKKWSNSSNEEPKSRDSAIGHSPVAGELKANGKSSPSSSSVSSKDSGCSEPPPLVPIRNSRPLSALLEKAESPKDRSTYSDDETVEVIRAFDRSSSSSVSVSPPRTDETHPGFSSKARRSLFRAAINELEDVFEQVKADSDLLDRAERRDLPTAHQELIAQARLHDEDTSHNSSAGEMVFSDMDNFMNWNTSSSFENLDEGIKRARTPATRRSGVIDKTTDDMVYRLCRANNRPPPTADPGAKSGPSYMLLSPALTPASSTANVSSTPLLLPGDKMEPDVHWDDAHFRSVRDKLGKIPEKPPQFGIPREKSFTSGCSNKDYLHAVPDSERYRSTFHAMRNHDTVLDDLAFRALRRDDNLTDPGQLGIVKDPNNVVPTSSCWRHKMEEEGGHSHRRPTSPLVFYPNRHNKLMQSLSENIAKVIRKQSGQPRGGMESKVVSYEDCMKDPDVMETMKYVLHVPKEEENTGDENDEIIEGKPRWAGKTIYELFKIELEKHNNKKQTLPEDETNQDLTVQHCSIEHQPLEEPLESQSKSKEEDCVSISSNLVQDTSSSFRALERIDTGEDSPGSDSVSNTEEEVRRSPESLPDLSEQLQQPDQVVDVLPLHQPHNCNASAEGGETGFLALLDNPAVLAACYCLVCLHQLGQYGGLDFLSTLGMVLAIISMLSMFFI